MEGSMNKDKIILTKEEYDDLCSNYDKIYEQAKADILGNISDGGTSCHWCIDENRRIGKEEALKRIWHKVSDGDLPEIYQSVLVAIKRSRKDGNDYIFITIGKRQLLMPDVAIWDIPQRLGPADEIIAWTNLPEYKEI